MNLNKVVSHSFVWIFSIVAGTIIHIVSKCPLTLSDWKIRSQESNCTPQSGMIYHCMMTTQNNYAYFCYIPFSASPNDGCLILNTTVNRIQYTQCLNNTPRCPNEEDQSYSSYKIFKYPGCFVLSSITPEKTATSQQFTFRRETVPELQSSTTKSSETTVYAFATKFVSIAEKEETVTETESNISKELLYILVGVGIGVLALLSVSTAVIVCLAKKNRNYRKDVYFFKYGQNFDIKRRQEPIYDEIGEECTAVDMEETLFGLDQTHESSTYPPMIDVDRSSYYNENDNQSSSSYLSPIVQQRSSKKIFKQSDTESFSFENSSIQSYVEIVG